MGHGQQIDDRFDGGVEQFQRKHHRDDDHEIDHVVALEPQEHRGENHEQRDDQVRAHVGLRARSVHDAGKRVVERSPETH